MYPDLELNRLAAHKARLRGRIGVQRVKCAQAATQVLRPLAWLDRALALWDRISPLAKIAAIPLGFVLKGSASAPPRLLGKLLRWGPLVLGAVRGLTRARAR